MKKCKTCKNCYTRVDGKEHLCYLDQDNLDIVTFDEDGECGAYECVKIEVTEYYSVYQIDTTQGCYGGKAYVAAENAREANAYIKAFKQIDAENRQDSWGYCFVEEYNKMPSMFSDEKGIIDYGIYYKY